MSLPSVINGNWFENRYTVDDAISLIVGSPSSTSYILVEQDKTDTGRYANLVEAYETATTSTPGGNALSATNRACVIIPPGTYDAGTSHLDLDTDYVDVVAQVPEVGGKLAVNGVPLDPTFGNQPRTVIKGSASKVIDQSANDVRLCGFGIVNETSAMPTLIVTDTSGGSNSVYDRLWMKTLGYNTFAAWEANPTHIQDVSGVWTDCIAHNFAWRLGKVATKDSVFTAKMYNCHAGYFSFGGDGHGDGSGTYEIQGAYFEGCSAGKASYGSCEAIGIPTDADTKFVECDGGTQCWSIGSTFSGTLIRCRGDDICVASDFSNTYTPEFDGYAEDCIMGARSFGGGSTGKMSGHLKRCTVERGSLSTGELSYNCEGATIEDSRITFDTNNIDVLTLTDSNTVLKGSTFEVLAGGTGIPVNAGSAKNVVAVGCIFNNGANDADGLGANVTNLATTAGNAIY